MKFNLSFTTAALCLSLIVSSQTPGRISRTCGPVPSAEWNNWFNARVTAYKNESAMGKSQVATVIPVVVHVIHGGQNVGVYPNITQAQVNSQIVAMNADFAGTGLNVNNVPSVFSSLVANTGISFCLAQLAPDGSPLPEAGIDRHDYHNLPTGTNPGTITTDAAFMSHFDQVIKPATIWDPTLYFNIWVSDVKANSVSILGYASFPASSTLPGNPQGGNAVNDGVWVGGRYFGTTGPLTAPYNKGRTATHETGHWLGLRHITGDANCGNDYCNDTPGQAALNFGCPGFPKVSCTGTAPNGEMFMNFMDYCDDQCLYMFTPDQNTRMQTALINSPFRNQLGASSATMCNLPASAASADFVGPTMACIDSSVVFINASTGMPGPLYTWSVSPAGNATIMPNAAAASPTIVFGVSGQYSIRLIATNSGGSSTITSVTSIIDCADGNTVGIVYHEFDKAVRLVPNPSRGSLTIEAPADIHGLSAEIHNCLGQRVYQQNIEAIQNGKFSLNLDYLPNGVYVVTLRHAGMSSVKRLVLDK